MSYRWSRGSVELLVENLSKCYQITRENNTYPTLRGTVHDQIVRLSRTATPFGQKKISDRPETESLWALRDVSFQLSEGEILGLIGGNGAGKSTLLKIVSRVIFPTSGRVTIRGRVGSLLEVGTGFHPDLSGRENVFLNGAILGMSNAYIRRHFDEIVEFAGISGFMDTPVKRYSSGMQVRLAFAVAAHMDCDLLLMDESLSVGDAAFQAKCAQRMRETASEGRTVLMVSHDMDAVKELCRRVIWLNHGVIEAEGKPEEVIDRYLGGPAKSLAAAD